MIIAERLPGGFEITQAVAGPVVYFDQWLWCDLADDAELREQLIATLTRTSSAVAYSLMNLAELTKITDTDQWAAITEFSDAVDYAFIDSDQHRVIAREQSGASHLPCMDTDLVTSFFANQRPTPARTDARLQMSDYIAFLQGSDIQKAMREQLGSIENILEPIIAKARGDTAVLARAKARTRARTTSTSPPHTEDLLEAAIDFVVCNSTMKMGVNEWVDLFHTLVPVAYCQFVVLDKRWAKFVNDRVALAPPEIARTYWKGTLPNFLADLDAAIPI